MQNQYQHRSPVYDYSVYQQQSRQQQQQQQQQQHDQYNAALLSEVSMASATVNSSAEEEDPLPTFEEFQSIIENYLRNLSPKKRDKALVDHARYCLIQEVLKNPRNTSISTAQFRFWVKKMFQLQPGSYDLVCHDNKPVAMKEQIYDILVNAHKEAHHGGRDKTSAIVRNQFSWIPKELVARFVRQCPTCISRRNGSQSLIAYSSKTSSPRAGYSSSSSLVNYGPYDTVSMAAAAAAAAVVASSQKPNLLYTPSSKAESDMSASPSNADIAYKRSPNNNYVLSSPSTPIKRPFFGNNGFFETGDHYQPPNDVEYQIQSTPPSHRSPFNYRRQEFVNYSNYTENTPSYHQAIMNSYRSHNLAAPPVLDQASHATPGYNDSKSVAAALLSSNSILSHQPESTL